MTSINIDVQRIEGGVQGNLDLLNGVMNTGEPVMVLNRMFYNVGVITGIEGDTVHLRLTNEDDVELSGVDVDSSLLLFGEEGVYSSVK